MENTKLFFPELEFFKKHFGKDVYAVGGYVRDLYLNRQSKKSDLVDLLITHHPVDDIIKKLQPHGKINLVGKSFGIIKFKIKDRTYDIALPRLDRALESKIPSHKDFIVHTNPDLPIEDDLKRRDFRCNSIALRLFDSQIIDPLNGRSDIKKKVIRLTNPNAFPEDPLRILRAARFASVLGMSIEKKIYEISKTVNLSGLSVERVMEEVFKILLASSQPSIGLEELFKLDVLRQLFPKLYALSLCIQDSIFHPEKDDFGHHNVWTHTKMTVDQATRLALSFKVPEEEKLALLLASLYHDTGKSQTTEWEFKKGRMVITSNGHDNASAEIVNLDMERLNIYSWNGFDLRKIVPALIRCHHRASELWSNRKVVTKKAFNRLASEIDGNIMLLTLLDICDRAGRSEKPIYEFDEQAKWLLTTFNKMNITKESIKPLLQGRNLLNLGVKPGPKMGDLLKKLYELQLDNEFETKEEGIAIAKCLIKEEKK